jgi:hypothetical protein
MRSQEFQVQEGDCGDYWSIDGSIVDIPATGSKIDEYVYDSPASLLPFSYTSDNGKRCIKNPDAEKPTGEWNTVELICIGEDSIHVVNGKVVMRLRGPKRIDGAVPAPVTSGPVILQSEGAEVFYRNIEVRSIEAVPAEFSER